MNKSIHILGVMTGTSCDGIDLACLEIQNEKWKVLWTQSEGYPSSLKKRVLKIQAPGNLVHLRDLLEVDLDLGIWYSKVIQSATRKHKSQRPDVIANHGQTVAHFPKKKSAGTTLQLGEPTAIAHGTGITVVSHFRNGDLCAHGQGAPLVPVFHKMIADSLKLSHNGVSIHNIGGISNLTYILGNKTLAFDTGPGNILIDAATQLATKEKQSFDRSGLLAAHGAIDIAALKKMMKHSFFNAPPPKSTGRDDFPFEFLLKTCKKRNLDLVATATALTAWSIALSYRKWIFEKKLPLQSIFLCGGGAKNHYLTTLIQDNLPEVHVRPLEEVSQLSGDYIEAAGFGYLGYLALKGMPVGGKWTGAQGFGPPGCITPGENWNKVRTLLSRL